MALIHLLETNPTALIILGGLLGLMVGSFLNVLVYRLPIMMERSWEQESIQYLGLSESPTNEHRALTLSQPSSHCTHCGAPIRPWQNIPIVSYLILGGQCANCKTAISIRYPLVEAFTAVLSAVVVWHFGFTIQAGMALILTWGLISLSLIDIDRQLLPDAITLPLLWIGLALSTQNLYTDSHSSIIGAISGYLILWSVYKVFKALTGKEGMGFGDFKLLAMLGAWMGWQVLPVIILFSSFVGAVTGTTMMIAGKHNRSTPIPFGPYLSAAGWVALLWGDYFLHSYLELVG